MNAKHKNCPDCGNQLQRVRQTGMGWLNAEQFDSVKAGDFYCDKCNGTRGKSTYRYFWESELREPTNDND